MMTYGSNSIDRMSATIRSPGDTLNVNTSEYSPDVIVSSSDPTELVGLCDRVLVMMRGRIVAELGREGLGVDELVAVTTGAREAAHA